MTSPAFEAFLAKLYVDAPFRDAFLRDPGAAARAAGLTETECAALAAIDRQGLELAGDSFDAKRKKHPPRRQSWFRRWAASW